MDKKDNRYYGEFGGQYVSESLMNTLDELEKAFDETKRCVGSGSSDADRQCLGTVRQ